MAKGMNLSGLGALFGSEALIDDEVECALLPIAKLSAASGQARKSFDEDSLDELAESIREHGIIQPLTVRRMQDGCYEIIAGERRWRAARLLGMDKVPARIIEADDRQAMEMGLVENLQREDLNPIEEAQGYRTPIQVYGLTQEKAAERVGKSRPAVANSMRLLALPEDVIARIENGELSAGHGRALLALEDAELISRLADKVIRGGFTVRQTEALVRRALAEAEEKPVQPLDKNDATLYARRLGESLSAELGRKVRIVTGGRRSKIELEFYDNEDLEALVGRLRGENNKSKGKAGGKA